MLENERVRLAVDVDVSRVSTHRYCGEEAGGIGRLSQIFK
jgi:hypothetical protein